MERIHHMQIAVSRHINRPSQSAGERSCGCASVSFSRDSDARHLVRFPGSGRSQLFSGPQPRKPDFRIRVKASVSSDSAWFGTTWRKINARTAPPFEPTCWEGRPPALSPGEAQPSTTETLSASMTASDVRAARHRHAELLGYERHRAARERDDHGEPFACERLRHHERSLGRRLVARAARRTLRRA